MQYRNKGIEVRLDLASSGQMRRFLTDIPSHIGKAVQPDSMHAAIMIPEELAAAGLGISEQDKLPGVANGILTGMKDLEVIGAELSVVKNELRPYSREYGIEIDDEEGVCGSIRKLASEVIFEATGVKLRDYLENYYASVTEKDKRNRHRRPISYYRHFPQCLKIAGVHVGIREALVPSAGVASNYVNLCYRSRQVKTRSIGRR